MPAGSNYFIWLALGGIMGFERAALIVILP